MGPEETGPVIIIDNEWVAYFRELVSTKKITAKELSFVEQIAAEATQLSGFPSSIFAPGTLTQDWVALCYGQILFRSHSDRIRSAFLSKPWGPVLTKAGADSANREELELPTNLGRLDQMKIRPFEPFNDADVESLVDPEVDFASTFSIKAFRDQRPKDTFDTFIYYWLGRDQDHLKLLGKMKAVIPTATLPATQYLASKRYYFALWQRVENARRSPQSPGPAREAIRVTMAFADVPGLESVCRKVVTDPSVCNDVPVVQGTEFDWYLTRDKANGMKLSHLSATGIEGFVRNCLYSGWSAADITRLHLTLTKIKDALTARRLPLTQVILLPSNEEDPSMLAHEYAHALFDKHEKQIQPQYLPRENDPILSADLFERFAEQVLLEDGMAQAFLRIPDNTSRQLLAYKLGHEISYYSLRTEEFAYGFMVAFYCATTPRWKRSLDAFLVQEFGRQQFASDPPWYREYYRQLFERFEPICR
jgi:hypothetical protein